MQKYSDVVLDKNSKPVQGADVTVKTYPDGQAATIYGADGGPSVASVKTDSSGRFSFYAASGHYSVTVSGTGITPVDYNDIVLFDPRDLSASSGAGLIGWLRSATSAVYTTLSKMLDWQRPSVLEFMTDAQRADCELASPSLDHTSAFTALSNHLATTKRTGKIPARNYILSQTVDIQAGTTLHIDPGASITYTGATGAVFRVHNGGKLYGNGATGVITSTAWDDGFVLVNGSDKIKGDTPVIVTGFVVTGAGTAKGAALKLVATNAGDSIAFSSFKGFTAKNLLSTIIMDCGSSGTTDPATWHWINSNIFDDITSFSAARLLTITGSASTPAEVAGNKFTNCQYQTPGTVNGTPVHITGASNNTFNGLFIWDWNISANGSPIVIDGGAQWNNIVSNIDASQITGAATNKVSDLTGTESGQKIFLGQVNLLNRLFIGKAGVSGQYGATLWPDLAGNAAFNWVNDGTNFNFGLGSNPYAPAQILWRASGYGDFAVVPQASATPRNNGDLVFELTSNTQVKIKVKGSDGVVRSVSLTLA